MSSWAIVALVGILIWGVVQVARARAGIVTDEDGNQKFAASDNAGSRAELEATRRELETLRERVKVLERIATDANTGDAREQARIAAEIEALRGLPAARTEGTDQ
ncbi:hypothetical protein [Erythrobacter sp. CCH5-A1]|jgi:uncharacterized protein YlxW (UPF0749 family)|uniref:hypothetical protein n=1 Tax=Erythrobacter sp. CCH5-A1 TaxID=1768792 RepID=UPI000836D3F5|nr:hypothetical protein [Erythrobacter sp. CCH5-A1]